MDWTIKVLGVAAALVFGIWAPISYQASEVSNKDTDGKFSSITSQLSAWQTSAASAQASAAEEMSSMSKKMDFVATLSVYDFCQGKSSIPACVSVTKALDVNALVSSIVPSITSSVISPGGSAASSSTSRPTSSSLPPVESSPKGGPVKLKMPAILGIVFGIVVIMGLAIGFMAWRRNEARRKVRNQV
ncbi:hypothetical protein DM02DRAFT_656398 [Periconia macrospinosa]|uniref:Uncharacterized protein n=1 Tax=Periconia macrospinosa TaxID=97972 RepID=A0A2V1DQ31_9PLEO|nr:hypothetical protein DM02DRAFT_656398 [Periconia macrospinosa]